MSEKKVKRKDVGRQKQNLFMFSWSMHPGIRRDIHANLRFFSFLISIVLIILGAVVIIGWEFNIPLFTQLSRQLPRMTINTACGLLAAGFALLFSHQLRQYRIFRILRDVFALMVYILGSLTLFEYIFLVDLGIDNILIFSGEIPLTASGIPLRMALNSAVIFILSGIALFLLDRKIKNKYISQFLAITNFIILTPTFISYAYNINFLYGLGVNSKIAVHAALGFTLLNIGIIFARPTQGFMTLVVSNSTGGYLARQTLLYSIVGPFLLSWIVLVGYNARLYDTEFRFLLFTLLCIIFFTYLIWRTAQALYKIDIQKRQYEGNLQFLSSAGKVLASSINFRQTLRSVSQLAVSYIGEFCAIDMFDEYEKPKQIIFSGRDEKKENIIGQIRNRHLRTMYTSTNFSHAVNTKNAVLITEVRDEILQQAVTIKKDYQKVKALGISSIMIVPIISHEKVIGIMHFFTTDQQNKFTQSILATAEELAARAALAIENAKLFSDVNQALKIRDEFISIASHELKTPLTSLKVYTQILQKQLAQKKEGAALTYIQKMNSQVDRLAILISDLLDVTKVQVGKLSLSIGTVDLQKLVKEIVEDLQAITQTHKIVVQGSINVTVQGDKERIGQVIINMLTNAIKYSPKADQVIVTMEETNRHVLISVRDFGLGIDKAHQAKIFDRFYQVRDPQKTFSGLGMGLYIAKEIALRHDGDLLVESVKGKGSTFTLLLPRNSEIK